MKVWFQLMKGRRWTDADLITDAEGKAPMTAYYGLFDIMVEHGGRNKTIEIKYSTKGVRPTLKLG